MADRRCPTCGAPVRVVSSGEGTSYYEGDAIARLSELGEIKRLREENERLRSALSGTASDTSPPSQCASCGNSDSTKWQPKMRGWRCLQCKKYTYFS